MSLITTPRSDAECAYDLLEDIIKAIDEEPKRIRMGDWLVRTNESPEYLKEHDLPACGTVGCIAGWATVLKPDADERYWDVEGSAAELLGLTADQVSHLFYYFPAVVGEDSTAGTREYADKVIAHIREFMAANMAQLVERQIPHVYRADD